mmetsp:Transcript_15375/g.39409  ORF Transcript_15375/g.39409 Transcript_15375/m.39409 type:complete len:96 (+) Transcript_15375:379-666(+)
MEEVVMRAVQEEERVAVAMEEGAAAVMGWALMAVVVDAWDGCLARLVAEWARVVVVEDMVDWAAEVAHGVDSRVAAGEDSRGMAPLAAERVALVS